MAAAPADFPGTVVAVTHDRYFLDNVAGWILELDRGEQALSANGFMWNFLFMATQLCCCYGLQKQ